MSSWSSASRRALFTIGTALLSVAASAACHPARCSWEVDAATGSSVPVIVQYTADPTEAEVDLLGTLGPVTRRMHSIHAVALGVSASHLTALANRPGVKYISLDHTIEARQAASSPGPIGTTPEFTLEPTNTPWALARGYNGAGIGVAVIDSGITPTVDLSTSVQPLVAGAPAPASTLNSAISAGAGGTIPQPPVAYLGATRIVYSYNFTSPNPADTNDAFGHGTHVAGLIAGNGSSSTGAGYSRTFTGTAPFANLINLRVLDAHGAGADSQVIAAIEMAVQLKKTLNIKVINLSLGRPIFESYSLDPLCQAVEQAWKAGIVVVVAAGNDGRDLVLNNEGYGTINAPGNDPYAITVGAANSSNTASLADDVMATYSSKGPSFIDNITKPDLIAPGNLVTSILAPGALLQSANTTFYTPENWYTNDGSTARSTAYFPLSGTSMAAAITSGAVADLMEVAGYLTPDQVKVLLMASANKNVIPQTNVVTDPVSGIAYQAHNDPFTQGAGYLDLQATITNTWAHAYKIPSGYAMSPVATYATTGNVTLVTDAAALWDKPAAGSAGSLWSAGSIYGQGAFSTSAATALWGKTAVAGIADPEAFTALWGATALWSKSTPAAQSALWPAVPGEATGNPTFSGRLPYLTF